MKLVVGLGNPGEKYKNTRHNVGFIALDFLLRYDGYITAKASHEFKSEIYTWQGQKDKILFVKPQTYMNDSGQALKVICNFYKMDLATDLLVIQDEIDLPFGAVRLSKDASSAGHNGIKSIIENLGTQNFSRLRVGVESRAETEKLPTEAFVLMPFSEAEEQQLKIEIFPKIREEVERFIGIQS